MFANKPKTIPLKISGHYTFNFKLTAKSENGRVSMLYADANSGNENGMPLPVRCKWFRVKAQRTYQIPEISSNVYQINAEDIGCIIKVETTPIDPEEANGTAYA